MNAMNRRNALIAGAFAILAVLAVAGWARKIDARGTNAADAPYLDANGQSLNAPAYGTAVNDTRQPAPCVDENGQRVGYQQALYSPDNRYVSDRYVQSIHRPVVIRRQSVEQDYATRDAGGGRAYSGSSYSDRNYAYTERDVRRPRSTKKSVAIVAGSAGVGAAIGALAGGGKGAGIGALTGGAGGFIYDRLTHNR